MTHQQALNLILAHSCPNGHGTLTSEEEAQGVEGWVLETHCGEVRIKGKLVKYDPALPEADRYQYDIVGVQIGQGIASYIAT